MQAQIEELRAEIARRGERAAALEATLAAVAAERDRWHQAATAPRGWARIFRRA